MRKLVTLAFLLVVLVVADSSARAFAENRLGAALAGELGLEEAPAVEVRGWPFLWHAIRGDFEGVEVTANRFGAGDLVLDRVDLTMRGVSFSPLAALSGEPGRVQVGSGRGTARLSVAGVEERLRASGRLVGSISIADLPGVEVQGRTLSLGPLDLELPIVAEGMTYTSARLQGGTVRLRFRLERSVLQL